MKRTILLLSAFFTVVLPVRVFANSAPVVSNVTAAQREDVSNLVDIYYDLADADGDTCTIWVVASNDGGMTWRVPVVTVSGEVGSGAAPGLNKHIIWDAGGDIPGKVGNFKVRVFADDGQSSDGLVLIPAGEFLMGDSKYTYAKPLHLVYVDSFLMGRYEITNQQCCEYLNNAYSQGLIEVRDGVVYATGGNDPYCTTGEVSPVSRIRFTGSTFTVTSGNANHPMVMVSWYGAAAYCNWRSQQQGLDLCYDLNTWTCDFFKQGFRLPTEAEWEYAARGGLSSKPYPWGDTIDGSMANYTGSTDPYEAGSYPFTTPVGFYNGQLHDKADFGWPGAQTSFQTSNSVNGYGLYDMAFNVSEWCNDWFYEYYYQGSPYSNPTGPNSGTYRISRGQGWRSPSGVFLGSRTNRGPGFQNDDQGFRVVLDF